MLTPSLSWGRGCRVVSCTGLSRQSPIPVAIYISSVIPCLLLALSLHKGTEVTVCLFFFFPLLVPHPSSAGFTLVALAAPSAPFHPALLRLRRAHLLGLGFFPLNFKNAISLFYFKNPLVAR